MIVPVAISIAEHRRRSSAGMKSKAAAGYEWASISTTLGCPAVGTVEAAGLNANDNGDAGDSATAVESRSQRMSPGSTCGRTDARIDDL
jgi:hypothetical protein